MFLGIDLCFIVSGLLFNNAGGIIMGVLLLLLSVGETAVGLGLCITSLKMKKKINLYEYTELKW